MPRRKGKPMPSYFASPEEMEACLFCRRNDIRISPLGIKDDPDHWKIEIRLGPYKRGEKGYIAPNIYDKDTIWIEYYRMCKYYYDKHTR